MRTRLNSRVKVRSRFGGSEGRTFVTFSREEVTDRSPHTTLKLNLDSNTAMGLVSKTKDRQTAEKAVGMDEVID